MLWQRVKIGALCAVLVFSSMVRDASAVTYRTVNVAGMYVTRPTIGQMANMAGGAMSRVTPWAVAFSVGMEIGKVIMDSTGGSISMQPRGVADAEKLPSQTFNGSRFETGFMCGSGTFIGSNNSADACMPGLPISGAGSCQPGTCQVDSLISNPTNPLRWNWLIRSLTHGTTASVQTMMVWRCTGSVGAWSSVDTITGYLTYANACAPVNAPQESGGTTSWTPKAIPGASQMGWEAPTAPSAGPQTFTPSDTFTQPAPATSPANKPEITITPNPDGGVTINTYYPDPTSSPQSWFNQQMTINNYGNVTNITTTTIIGGPPSNPRPPMADPAATPPPTECGSLSCEATQQQIKTELIAAAAPPLPPQEVRITDREAADADKMSTMPAAIVAAKSTDMALWFAWAWTPPVGGCTNPTGSIRGTSATLDICPTVDKLRDVLGWLFAVFGAWSIYGAIFRRPG